MRMWNYKALVLGVAGIAVSGSTGELGCSATKPTEIVPGALTQVQVPRDLGAIKLIVNANGQQVFCQGYTVSNGAVVLPSTLGVIGGNSNVTLRVSLYGYDSATANSNDVNSCNGVIPVDAPNSANNGQGPGARVLRQAVLTYVDQQTLFLPMPLSFSCYDVDCSTQGADSTCKGGQCQDGNIAASSLAPFTPSLIDGTGDCFNLAECFPVGVSAVPVDAANCVYGVPQQLQGGSGLNARVFYQTITWTPDPGTGIPTPVAGVPTEQEILSEDANEGFTIPDPTQPQQFQLAPGLCNLVKAQTSPTKTSGSYAAISDVQVSTSCPPKLPLLPFCAGEQQNNVSSSTAPQDACGTQIPLEPTPSAVYLLMDDSGAMKGAFGAQGYATAMNFAFQYPVFRKTYIAFRFLSHLNPECPPNNTPTSYGTPAVPFGLAGSVEPLVAPLLTGWAPADSPSAPLPLDLQAAMRLDQGAYPQVLSFGGKFGGDAGATGGLNVAAVMFFVNRTPVVPPAPGADGGSDFPTQAADCLPTGASTVQASLAAEAQAAAAAGARTYFVVLNDQESTPQPQLDFYNGVATAAGSAVTVVDATSTSPDEVVGNFQNTVASAATCVYETPQGVDTTAQLSFSIPPQTPGLNTTDVPLPISIPQSSSCTAATSTSANGWNIEPGTGRIRLCGQACSNLQATFGAVALGALQKDSGDGGAEGGLPTGDGGAAVPDVPVTVSMPCGDGGAP